MKREHLWEHHELDATRYWKLLEGGYAHRSSVRVGERIQLHISNSRPSFPVDIFREGSTREHLMRIEGVRGTLQAVPENGYANGFGWQPTVEFEVPESWRSGVFIAAFPTAQGPREILFVVRPAEPRASLLVTIAMNTYAAYNNVGGACFYNYISRNQQHSKVVSFQRPLQPGVLGNFYFWDQFFTSWLDAEGIEADFCVNLDHDREPDLLSSYRANLRIGHDEYNSRAECEQLQEFVRSGGNLLLFTGNAFCQLVEPRGGRDDRLFCSKPHYHDTPTSEKPETSFLRYIDDLRQRTIGVCYTSFVNAKTDRPKVFRAPTSDPRFGHYWVTDEKHWIYEGTGLKNGDVFGGEDSIVGVEADAADLEFVDGRPEYTGLDGVSKQYRILALANAYVDPGEGRDIGPRGPLRAADGDANAWGTVAINETEFDGTVFNAATIEWGHGLHDPASPVARITRNVLDRLAR
jgi:hypothetical protein